MHNEISQISLRVTFYFLEVLSQQKKHKSLCGAGTLGTLSLTPLCLYFRKTDYFTIIYNSFVVYWAAQTPPSPAGPTLGTFSGNGTILPQFRNIFFGPRHFPFAHHVPDKNTRGMGKHLSVLLSYYSTVTKVKNLGSGLAKNNLDR